MTLMVRVATLTASLGAQTTVTDEKKRSEAEGTMYKKRQCLPGLLPFNNTWPRILWAFF